jgi:predicted dehydrogenase
MMELLRAGAVGEVRLVTGSFGYRAGFDPKSRLFDRSLGGGALLDVGIYTIWLAHTVFAGEPERVLSMADIGKTGVDEQSAMILGYPRGAMALLVAAVRAETQQEGAIYGTDGRMRLGPPFWQPDAVVLSAGDREETFSFKREGNGYNYQAAEVMRCLREGRTESDFMPHSKTLAMMRTLDRARAPWGLVYPGE